MKFWQIVMIIVVMVFSACRGNSEKTVTEPQRPAESPVDRAMAFYDTRELFERPMAHSAPPEGLGDMRSSTCGACHKEIYREWQISTHARAWKDDAQFMAELDKSRGHGDPEKNGDVGWLCVNCHTPMVAQLPELVVGLEDNSISRPQYVKNPAFDAGMQDEAIGCATCHVRDGKVMGPYGDTNAPHAVAKSEELLTEAICVRCHQAEQFYESQNLGCFFTTGAEWAQSSYARDKQYCQSCHMPEVTRRLAEDFKDRPERVTRRHWFGGSLIPKKPEFAAELAPLQDVFGHGLTLEMRTLTGDLEHVIAEQPPMAEVDQKEAAAFAQACDGTCVKLALAVKNENAGHRVPTGDPERHVDIVAWVEGPEGARVSGAWIRLGSRYEWWPKTRKLADTRIAPGESRVMAVDVPAKGEFVVRVRGSKYRMYQDAFDYHKLEGRYVRGMEFLSQDFRVRDGVLIVKPEEN